MNDNERILTAGNKKSYIYFDTEFTGLRKDTSLISIGLVTYDDKTFYAELTDYKTEQVDDWIENNVISKLTKPKTKLSGNDWTICGTTQEVSTALNKWLKEQTENNDDIMLQFTSDVSHYDFVLLVDLLLNSDNSKTVFDLPKYISPTCYDINHDIANLIQVEKDATEEELKNIIPINIAFDLNREEIVKEMTGKIFDEDKKHNSLYDAIIIKTIHQYLYNL